MLTHMLLLIKANFPYKRIPGNGEYMGDVVQLLIDKPFIYQQFFSSFSKKDLSLYRGADSMYRGADSMYRGADSRHINKFCQRMRF